LPDFVLIQNGFYFRPASPSITLKFIFKFSATTINDMVAHFPLQEPEMEPYRPAGENIRYRFLKKVEIFDIHGNPYKTGFIGGSTGSPFTFEGFVEAGEGVHLALLEGDLVFENEQTPVEILAKITFFPGFNFPEQVFLIIPIRYLKSPAGF